MSTPPLRVLVVDDEPLARRGIRARLGADIEVVGECGDGAAAVRAIAALAPDVVFLDVRMPGLDGFAVVDAVGAARMPVTIFVTAHDAHALRAFDAQALDYVVKPIDDDRFARALARARARVRERRAGSAASPPLAVHDRGTTRLVPPSEIRWIEADGDYARLHVAGGSHLERVTMRELETRLDPATFVRIHRSAIVNARCVRRLRALPNRELLLTLADGSRLRASRTYAERLRRVLGVNSSDRGAPGGHGCTRIGQAIHTDRS